VLLATLGSLVVSATVTAPPAQAAPVLPAGFVITSTPGGQAPYELTDFGYLPDGSMITIGKGGKVAWISTTGAVRTLAQFDVTTVQDLGLVGLAVAPDYETSKTIYLARALPGPAGNWPLRLSRHTVTGSPEPTGLTGEVTLLQTTATSDVHAITGIVAAPDGTLWVSVGDAADFRRVDPAALRSLDVNDPRGKVLHIDATSGAGVAGNPYYDAANPAAARSKVYAMGFRSPFRLTVDPATGSPVLGDVGWNTFEEVDLIRPGASYGWPCFEGNIQTPGYRDLAGCAGATNTAPSHFYDRPSGNGSSVTGGVFYTGETYPAAYRGSYFFGDYTSGRIWTMAFGADGRVVRAPEAGAFGRDMGGPVNFESGPNGDIVYADIIGNTINRISYASGNRAPTASATTTTDPTTRTVSFDGSASYDIDGDPLSYRWSFGDGATGTGVRTTHTYAAGTGALTARLTVTDRQGLSGSTDFTVAPSNNTPQLTVDGPGPDEVFAVGDTVEATAIATDVEDGSLTVEWTTTALHCRGEVCHAHPGPSFRGNDFSQVFDDHGDDTEQRITATATDSAGVSASQTFVARPDLRTLTVTTSVPATTTINGVDRAAADVTVGATVSVSAAATASDGVSTFAYWTDGGPRARELVVGTQDIELSAVYQTPIDQRYASDPGLRAAVGTPTAPETGDTALRWRDYTNGRVYWTAATGVKAVQGAINAAFLRLGAHGGVGVPTSDELGSPDGVGRYNTFTNGRAIYWTPSTGAQMVEGRIRFRWDTLGAERGFLRYPITNETATPDGIGRFNHFQGGSVYWSPATDAWSVRGAIKDRWARLGWERSPLGYPTTNENGTPDRVGRYNHFQGASIYWTPRTGAQDVRGAIRARWQQLGWERSYLGYPTSGEFAISGGRRSNFERGYITWNARTGQVIDRRY